MVYIIILVLLIMVPGVPLAVSWWHLFFRRCLDRKDSTLWVALVGITMLSYVWFLAGLWRHEIWGSDYSALRYAQIEANFMIALAGSGVAGLIESAKGRWWLISSAGAVSINWYYALIINLPWMP